jgi:hypothetical protein
MDPKAACSYLASTFLPKGRELAEKKESWVAFNGILSRRTVMKTGGIFQKFQDETPGRQHGDFLKPNSFSQCKEDRLKIEII